MGYINVPDKVKSNIHLYVILELAIKSVQHDQQLFESFKIKRPYLSFCDKQIVMLKEEFKNITKVLYKQGVKFEKYMCINKHECIYSFKCQGEVVPFHYHGNVLKNQVERKLNFTWKLVKGEKQHESTEDN